MNRVHHKFYGRLILLSIPAIAWMGWQLVLPYQQYSFRAWEAIINTTSFLNGAFYPNQSFTMTEVGDAEPYTAKAIPHRVQWQTDEEGYRNERPSCANPDGVLIGDSAAVGTSMDQEEIASVQLSKNLHQCVRSFAGADWIRDVTRMVQLKMRPKWVYLVLVERSAPFISIPKSLINGSARPTFDFGFLNLPKTYATHLSKNLYWNYRAVHGVTGALHRSFMNENQRTQMLAPELGSVPSTMTYIGDSDRSEHLSEEGLEHSVEILKQISAAVKKNGSTLIFTFVPSKYTLYGNAPSHFNDRFKQKLVGVDFVYIDLIKKLTELHQKKGTIFHQLDDSHWNGLAVKEYVNLVTEYFTQHQL